MRIRVFVALLVLLVGRPALAQTPAANPYTKGVRDQFDYIHKLVMKSAERLAEDLIEGRAHRRLEGVRHHAWEHYGNLVTYMRLKGIVPPSSER